MGRHGVVALTALLCLAALLADPAPALAGPGSRLYLPLVARDRASTATSTATATSTPTGTAVPNSGPTPTPTAQTFGPTPTPGPTPPSGCGTSQQLIANGGFEDWPEPWKLEWYPPFDVPARSTDYAFADRWSLRMVNLNSQQAVFQSVQQTVAVPAWASSGTLSFRWAAVITDWAGLKVGGYYGDTLNVSVRGEGGELTRWTGWGYPGTPPDQAVSIPKLKPGRYGWFDVRLPLGGKLYWYSEPTSLVDYAGKALTVSFSGSFGYFLSTIFYVDEVRLDVCG